MEVIPFALVNILVFEQGNELTGGMQIQATKRNGSFSMADEMAGDGSDGL